MLQVRKAGLGSECMMLEVGDAEDLAQSTTPLIPR